MTWQAPGLNHNIWLTHFYHEGVDAYPLLEERIENESEKYWGETQEKGEISAQMSPSAIHQYRMFGLMPVGDTPRRGARAGLPDDVVVEVPAVVNKKGIQPLRVEPLPPKVMLACIYPDWMRMKRTLEALLSGDLSMLLFGVLDSHQTRSYEQAEEVMEALLNIEPNEPMAYVEDINDHYQWPRAWRLR